jgi:hypothetical protein
VGVESGTPFTEVEFEGSDSEWVDYDEKVRTSQEIMTTLLLTLEGTLLLVKSKEPVGISEFESLWSRA